MSDNKLVNISDIGATGGAIAVKEYAIYVTKANKCIAKYDNGNDGGKKCIAIDKNAIAGENNIIVIDNIVLYYAIISYININLISTKAIKTLGV